MGQLPETYPARRQPLARRKNHSCRCSTKNAPHNKNSARAKTRPVQQTTLVASEFRFMACSMWFETKTWKGPLSTMSMRTRNVPSAGCDYLPKAVPDLPVTEGAVDCSASKS